MRIDLYQWNLLEIMKGKLDLLQVHMPNCMEASKMMDTTNL